MARGLPWAIAWLTSCLALAGCPEEDSGGPGPGGSGGDDLPVACDVDDDGFDSFDCGGGDCDDRNRFVHPGAPESCGDRIDQNCSGVADEGCDCRPGEVRVCYPLGLGHASRGVGACIDGLQACGADGRWEETCEGAVVPGEEGDTADGLDQDCDGESDEGLLNRCGTAGDVPPEVCGNGLDDDCDGHIDPPELCTLHCGGIDPLDPPPGRECCVIDPDDRQVSRYPVRYSRLCIEGEGLPACAERECLALTAGANCIKVCRDTDGDGAEDRCLCGLDGSGVEPEASEACGFATPCVFEDCADRLNQPCYSGPPITLGVGICRAGWHSCRTDGDDRRAWTACEGQVLPSLEICGNGLDDDCDGFIDEADGTTGRRCDQPVCAPGAQESCGNGLDDDCDGLVDEGCRATAEEQACFRGPPAARGRGICRDGIQRNVDGHWGPCEGDVLPSGEICGDGIDSDCNGAGGPEENEDTACCIPSPETCNSRDDDCDGRVDGGVADACGNCTGACWERTVEEPADCGPGRERSCTGLEGVPGDPGAIALRVDKRQGPEEEVLHVVNSHQLVQFSITHRRTNWSVPSPGGGGWDAGIATAADNSSWFGSILGLTHVSAGGTVICRYDRAFNGVAIDPDGFVWAAADSSPELFRFDPARILTTAPDGRPWPDGVPRCAPIDLDPGSEAVSLQVRSANIGLLGLAVDDRGILWASEEAGRFVFRLDTLTLQGIDIPTSTATWPAVAPNRDVWFARASSLAWEPGLVRIDADGPYHPDDTGGLPYQFVDVFVRWHAEACSRRIHEIVIDEKGQVWGVGCHNPSILFRYRPSDADIYWFAGSSTGWVQGLTLALDTAGGLWTAAWSPHDVVYVHRLDPEAMTWESYPIPMFDGSPIAHGDPTGFARHRRATPVGRWTETLDAGWNDAEWISVDWEEYEPAGASVELAVRFGPTREELAGVPVACRFRDPPADLTGCGGLQSSRYMSMEFELASGSADGLPILRNIRVGWTRR